MAVLFKKALFDCLGVDKKEVSLKPKKVPSVYDACEFYWLPLDERMWTGEIEFRYIASWADEVEQKSIEDVGNDINNNNKSITKPSMPSVYDACECYWLPLDERMWTGEIQFRYIANWAEEVELNSIEDVGDDIMKDKNNNNRPITKPSSVRRTENWDNDLFTDSFMESKMSWEGDFYSDKYMNSFNGS